MMRHRWFERPVTGLVLFTAVVLLGSLVTAPPASGQSSKLVVGFVMHIDDKGGTVDIERQRGDFATLYLSRETRWVLKKLDIGDRVHAVVVNLGGRMVVKDISFQMGPAVQMDIIQGVVTKMDPKNRSIEIKTSLGTDEVLYLDENALIILTRLTAGDTIEARVETVIEEGGSRQVARTILIGKGF